MLNIAQWKFFWVINEISYYQPLTKLGSVYLVIL